MYSIVCTYYRPTPALKKILSRICVQSMPRPRTPIRRAGMAAMAPMLAGHSEAGLAAK